MHRDLKAAREDLQSQEQSFQRELSAAQKLGDMYKDMANARIQKCENLEGVLRELKTHLEVQLLWRSPHSVAPSVCQKCEDLEGVLRELNTHLELQLF